MPLDLFSQYEVGSQAFATGDFRLLEKVLLHPDSITPDENRSVAQKLGFKGGFEEAIGNIVMDPMIWVSMYLSRKFPTKSYLTGTIPHRFIGTAKEFTGASYFGRSLNRFHIGTVVPPLVALQMKRKAEVLKVSSKLIEELRQRPNWAEEKHTVSLLLEGQSPHTSDPSLRALAERIRGHMDELWGFLHRARKIEGGILPNGEVALARDAGPLGGAAPQYLRDYLPHIPLTRYDSLIEADPARAILSMKSGGIGQMLEARGVDPASVWTKDAAGRLSSNWHNYQAFMNHGGAQALSPRLFKRSRHNIPLESAQGQELFVTDLDQILLKYTQSVAHTYANFAPLTPFERSVTAQSVEGADGIIRTIMPTDEPLMVQIINEGLRNTGAQFGTKTVPGTNIAHDVAIPGTPNKVSFKALTTLIHQLNGREDEGQLMIQGLLNPIYDRLHADKTMTAKQKGDITAALAAMQDKREFTRENLNRLGSYFYSTTLGMNIGSSLRNLFQPFVTTMPTIGIGPTLHGYWELSKKIPTYLKNVAAYQMQTPIQPGAGPIGGRVERLSHAVERAFAETFPEMDRLGLRADPQTLRMKFEEAVGKVNPNLLDRTWQRVKPFIDAAMLPFTQAEQANQIVTFVGAKKALKSAILRGDADFPHLPDGTPLLGGQLDEWLGQRAADLVSATQYRPGPGTTTPFLAGVHPLFKQFSNFSMRSYNFIANSTIQGALTDRQLQYGSILEKMTGGRNLGGLARMYIFGKTMNEGMKGALGVDMSSALGIMSPFDVNPATSDLIPFAVPPAYSLAQGMVSYAATRDIKRLQPLTLPGIGDVPVPKLLVPGGVSISRAARAYNMFKPDVGGMTDENERLMYKAGSSDVAMAMLGIPLDKDRRMREQLDRIQDVKWRIRDLKRQQAHASISGDTKAVDAAAAQYAQEFPDFAQIAPLAPTIKDIKRYQQERTISVVQRMLHGMSREIGTQWEDELAAWDPELMGGM